MIYRVLFLLFLTTSLYAETPPEGFSVDITLSQETISLDDTLEVAIIIKHPLKYTVDPNVIEVNLLQQHTFLLDSKKISQSPPNQDGIVTQYFTFILEPLVTGSHMLTLGKIPFTTSTGKSISFISGQYPITITPISTTLHIGSIGLPSLPVKPQITFSLNSKNRKNLYTQQQHAPSHNLRIFSQRTLPWDKFLWAVTFFIFVYGVYLLMKIPPTPDEQRAERIKTSQANALKSLARLSKRELPKHQLFDKYYVELTHTVRRYIEDRYQLHAQTHTTQEFLQEMTTTPLFATHTQLMLKNFLIHADKVKFARHIPSLKQCEKAEKSARSFIQQ